MYYAISTQLFIQMWMSVKLIRLSAVIGLTASMLFYCCSNIVPVLCYYYAYTVLIIPTCYFLADVDECKIDLAQCGDSASCTNTVGSYICNCKQGYVGIGNVCNGE